MLLIPGCALSSSVREEVPVFLAAAGRDWRQSTLYRRSLLSLCRRLSDVEDHANQRYLSSTSTQ